MGHRYIVSAPDLPASPAPISQAVVAGQHCYISGQLATNIAGEFCPGSVREEAQLAFLNLFAALRAAGFSGDDLVCVDIAFTDLDGLSEVNAIYAELFVEGRRPARTVYQVSALPYDGKIKVQGVAIKQE